MLPQFLATLLLLTLVGVARAEEPVVVNGAGDPVRDVPAVQAAVDRGCAVVLKGTFDFGERGRVTIRRSVSISGNVGASLRDARGATIKGGFWTFFSPLPDKLPPEQPSPRISIEGLRFEAALWAPINIAHASGVRIVGNSITNVRPHPGQLPGIGEISYQQGILVGWTTGVDAHIARNRISNASRNSIEAVHNYQGLGGRGRVRIEANTIATASLGLPWPGPQTPNGVVVGFPFDPAAAVDPGRNIRYEVEARGRTSMGVVVGSDGTAIKDNEVSTSGTDALAISVASSNGQVVGNIFRGSGKYAIRVAPRQPMAASGNHLEGNDLRQYEASDAQVHFAQGSGNNICTGNHALIKVVDLGSGNRCP